MEPMEPTEPENRKAQQDSPPKTQEIEVSRGWDEDLRMYWLMDKSDLSFPVFCWLAFITIVAAQQTFAGQRSRISCDLSNPCEGPEFGSPKKNLKIQLKP